MATIINNPGESSSGNNMGGFIVALIVGAILLILFFLYALPALRGGGETDGDTQINVPDKLEVDVNKGQ